MKWESQEESENTRLNPWKTRWNPWSLESRKSTRQCVKGKV